MIWADFPPSSKETLLTVLAASCWILIPTSVDPVKEIISIILCSDIIGPRSDPWPLTILKPPLGRSEASIISAIIFELNGQYSLGFITIEQPAPIAEDILVKVWLRGQFHGVINAATPIGVLKIL